MPLIGNRIRLSGSCIGGMADTQEVIDFCHKHGIKPEIEIVTSDQLDEVYDNLHNKNDTIKRFVLDIVKSVEKA